MGAYIIDTVPRGLVLILNYKFVGDPINERPNADADVAQLNTLFKALTYEVKMKTDLSKEETLEEIESLCKGDRLKSVSCMLTVILSHGESRRTFYAADKNLINVNEIWRYYSDSNCPNMRGKPKLFLFHFSCGGDTVLQISSAIRPVSDLQNEAAPEACNDMISIFSPEEDCLPRAGHTNGTPFINVFCKTLNDKSHYLLKDFLSEFTKEYKSTVGGQLPDVQSFNFEKRFTLGVKRDAMPVQAQIDDFSIAQVAEMLNLKPLESANILISSDPLTIPDLLFVLHYVAKNKVRLNMLFFKFLFENPTYGKRYTPVWKAIKEILKRCPVCTYMGPFTPSTVLPETMQWLRVSLRDSASHKNLLKVLPQCQNLTNLDICIHSKMNPSDLKPIPNAIPYAALVISDTKSKEKSVKRAIALARTLYPSDRGYRLISFISPLRTPDILFLLENLQGIKMDEISFNRFNVPESEMEKIEQISKEQLKVDLCWLPYVSRNTD